MATQYKGVDPVSGKNIYYDTSTGLRQLSDAKPSVNQVSDYNAVEARSASLPMGTKSTEQMVAEANLKSATEQQAINREEISRINEQKSSMTPSQLEAANADTAALREENARLQTQADNAQKTLNGVKSPSEVAATPTTTASTRPVNDKLAEQTNSAVPASQEMQSSAGEIAQDQGATITNNVETQGGITTANDGRVNSSLVGGASTTPTILGGNMLNPNDTISPDFNPVKVEAEENESTLPKSEIAVDPNKTVEFDAQPNMLGKYATTSYTIAIYILKNEQNTVEVYQTLPNDQLIIQSGGISTDGRNPYFNLDFFISDLDIESLIGTKNGGRITNATNLEFTIVEPYGLSFLDRLSLAVRQITGNPNYPQQPFLMTIKFYGYNENGKAINEDGSNGPVVTKYIPFILAGVSFRVQGKHTEYRCKGIPWNQTATSSAVNVIPFNLEFTASTVKEFLTNNTSDGSQQDVASGKIVTAGLAAALNNFQVSISGQGKAQLVPDEYEFIIAEPKDGKKSIGDAKIRKPGSAVVKSRTPTAVETTKDVDVLLKEKGWVSVNDRVFSVAAGQSITELIELLVRTSSYITDQSIIQVSEADEPNQRIVQQQPVDVLQWFRIITKVEIKEYDTARATNACKYTYIIEPYTIHNPGTVEFNATKLKGVHKKYNYWYTGENTEILAYEQEYNYAFYTTFGNNSYAYTPKSDDYGLLAKPPARFMAESNESSQPAMSDTVRATSQAASVLYSIGDINQIKIKVLGDPAWLQQEAFTPNGPTATTPFTADGSINGNVGEVIISIKYHLPTDYNLATGLQDPNSESNMYVGDSEVVFNHTFEQNYMATQIVSHFTNGMFTQDIEGLFVAQQLPNSAPNSSVSVTENSTKNSNNASSATTPATSGKPLVDLKGEVASKMPSITPRIPSIAPEKPMIDLPSKEQMAADAKATTARITDPNYGKSLSQIAAENRAAHQAASDDAYNAAMDNSWLSKTLKGK